MKHDLVVPESSKRMGIMPILLIVENPIFPGYGNLERLLPDKVMPDFSHQPYVIVLEIRRWLDKYWQKLTMLLILAHSPYGTL